MKVHTSILRACAFALALCAAFPLMGEMKFGGQTPKRQTWPAENNIDTYENNSANIPPKETKSSSSSSRDLFVSRNPLNDGSRTVVVKMLERPLDLPMTPEWGENTIRKTTDGAAAHVQIVVYDKKTGTMIDNFGYFEDDRPIGNKPDGRVRSESESFINRRYDKTPLGEYEMSLNCYKAGRKATENALRGAEYRLYNKNGGNVGTMKKEIADAVKAGTVAGMQVGARSGATGLAIGNSPQVAAVKTVGGGIAGAGGALVATGKHQIDKAKQYAHDHEARYNPEIISDASAQMSFPGVNCQYAPLVFIKHTESDPTFVERTKYIQPGETRNVVQKEQSQETIPDEVSKVPKSNLDLTEIKAAAAKFERSIDDLNASLERYASHGVQNNGMAEDCKQKTRMFEKCAQELKLALGQLNEVNCNEEAINILIQLLKPIIAKMKRTLALLLKLSDEGLIKISKNFEPRFRGGIDLLELLEKGLMEAAERLKKNNGT